MPVFQNLIYNQRPVQRLGGGGGDVTNLSSFWEGTARKYPLVGTYLTNPWSNAMNSGQTCRPCRGSHVVLSPQGAVLVTSPGTKSSYPHPPQSLNPSYREKCLMRCPSNQVIKSYSEKCFSSQRATRRQVMRYFTSNDIEQCQNGLSNLLTPYRKQPRPTQIVVAYPRPAFSATKRTHYAPISFAQQARVC